MGHTGHQKANCTGLASSKVRRVTSSRHLSARTLCPVQQILGPKRIAEHAAAAKEHRDARLNGEFCCAALISDKF